MIRFLPLVFASFTLTAAPLKITIGTLPGLQYDKPRFAVDPGQEVVLTFNNSDEMAHNLAFVAPGKRLEIVQAALTLPPDSNYIPKNAAVLWHTPVLKPDESAHLKFNAPNEKGIYPYVCTFPGHGLVMYGVMYVGITMPVLAQDQNVSPMARDHNSKSNLHPWPQRRPLMYRIFMPDASPSAIAVALPHGVSYCWDAGSCHMRYAWIGGFVDPMPVWKGNGNGVAKIIGTKFWTGTKKFPFYKKNSFDAKPQFQGYRKIDGHPEFHYIIQDIDVYERITALPTGMGLTRHYRIPDIKYALNMTIGIGNTKVSKGLIHEGAAILTPEEAKSFTITHRHSHGK
jgi:azurin